MLLVLVLSPPYHYSLFNCVFETHFWAGACRQHWGAAELAHPPVRFGGADKAARDKAAAKPGKAAAAAPAKDGELGGAEADKPKAGISKPVLSEARRYLGLNFERSE